MLRIDGSFKETMLSEKPGEKPGTLNKYLAYS